MTSAILPAPADHSAGVSLLPDISVLATKFIKGCTDPSSPSEALPSVPFAEAFTRAWDTDAHFVSYHMQHGGLVPRMTMEGLRKLRELGSDLVLHSMVFDYDNPNAQDADGNNLLNAEGKPYHAPWTPESKAAFEAHLFGTVIPKAPWIKSALTGFYYTKGGARFVFVLVEPVSVDRGEQMHKGLVVLLNMAGLAWAGGRIDDRCSDWTRVMRLPRVVRGGEATVPLDEFWNFQARLDPTVALGPSALNPPRSRPDAAPLKLPQPSDIRVHQILGGSTKPDWYHSAARDLKGKHCWTSVFEFREMAPEGTRNDTIQSYVGEVVALFHFYVRTNRHAVDPECVYALLFRAVETLGKDDDWHGLTWKAICRYWAAQDARVEERRGQAVITEITGLSITSGIVKRMRGWTNAPELHHDDASAIEYVGKKMIVASPAGYYVMGKDGHYDARLVSSTRLVPLIRELGMESVIPLGFQTPKEAWKAYTPQQLVDRHATIVNGVEGVACGEGNWVRGIGTPDATLILKLYSRRKDIQPTFNQDVDDWMRAIGGTTEGYQKLRKWVSYALAFDEGPTAALAITGVPGFGKKVLVNGLGETITSQRTVDAQEGSGFQSALLQSPYFIANEGFPVGSHRGYSPADTFRRLTGGDIVKAEKKFKDVIDIRVAVRVVLCANNLDIVRAIAGKAGDLSVDDKTAIAQRLVHLRVPPRAAVWLEQRGGPVFTKGWIAGDGGQPSRDVVAKHFLWLYEERNEVPKGQRFMMMGDIDARTLQGFNTQVGLAPIIMEAVAALLERLASGASVNGAVLIVSDDAPSEFWVTEHGVLSWIKQVMQVRVGEQAMNSQVGRSIRGILHPGSPEDGERRVFQSAKGKEEARWFRVNMREIIEEAIEKGWDHGAADKVLAASDKNMGQIIRMGV